MAIDILNFMIFIDLLVVLLAIPIILIVFLVTFINDWRRERK
jgi:hypothetical protein